VTSGRRCEEGGEKHPVKDGQTNATGAGFGGGGGEKEKGK